MLRYYAFLMMYSYNKDHLFNFCFAVFSCLSVIGKQAGRQGVYLGPGCENKGTILHELLHLLGFFHEHNRADRDTYLRIYEQNIADGLFASLRKQPTFATPALVFPRNDV